MKARVGDFVRICDAGYTTKTYFKVVHIVNNHEIVVEVDPIKNKPDKSQIIGWAYYENVHAKYLHLNLNNNKRYWFVYRYEIKRVSRLLSNE